MEFNGGVEIREHISNIRDMLAAESSGLDDSRTVEIIEDYLLGCGCFDHMPVEDIVSLSEQIFYTTRKDLGILQPYIENDLITEIMVNGYRDIFIETAGSIHKTDTSFVSEEELEELVRRIAGRVHKEINELNPILDARLEDGSRVNAVFGNIALGGPVLTIRKFPRSGIVMRDLLDNGTVTEEAADFLRRLVRCRYNIFVSGGTSSGKTTFLNVLSEYIPKRERIVVIEDSAELRIRNIDNVVRMECRPANSQGKGKVGTAELIRASLRMRPDRIIVGEVRGREIIDMIQAMNTGHDGSLSTGHGNSISGMLRRMEIMFMEGAEFPVNAIRSQIAEGIDIIVHLCRMPDGSRKVFQIAELTGVSNDGFDINPIFEFDSTNGLIFTGNELMKQEKMKIAEGAYGKD